jgi:hypothetical protein
MAKLLAPIMLHDMVVFATNFFRVARILLERWFAACSLTRTFGSSREPVSNPLENALESLP